MKAIKSVTAVFIALFMAVALSACAPSAKTEGTGGYIDDSVITTKVKSALLAEKDLKSTQISVETFKGRVLLSGFVNSKNAAERAIQVTRGVNGVQSVIDSMKVR